MLYSEAADDIRGLLQDRREPLRYTDDDIRSGVNNGLAAAYRMRPDIFYPMALPTVTRLSATDVADTTLVLPINDMFAPVIVEYAAGWLELREDEVTDSSRSVVLLGRMKSELGGGG